MSPYITKSIGSVNHFPTQRAANEFATDAKLLLLKTIDVRVHQDVPTGNWVVIQSLRYLGTEGEYSYAVPDVPRDGQ